MNHVFERLVCVCLCVCVQVHPFSKNVFFLQERETGFFGRFQAAHSEMLLFLSHTWCPDSRGWDTHSRVGELKRALEAEGHEVWFDEERLAGNIDADMADGIHRCDAVIIVLTKAYAEKVNRAAECSLQDNCHKEFSYSLLRGKVMVPLLFEPCMKDSRVWPAGIVPMALGNCLYVDASCAHSEESWEEVAAELSCLLKRRNSQTQPPPRMLPVTRTAPVLRADTMVRAQSVERTFASRMPPSAALKRPPSAPHLKRASSSSSSGRPVHRPAPRLWL